MMEAAFESRFVQRDGVRLHYVVVGDGPTLILVHGLPDFWKGWHFQIDCLRSSYRLVLVDLRGVNLSGRPVGIAAYGMGELVRDTLAVIDDIGLKKASIIGHDWGGTIGWWTAMLAPTRVERLAVLSVPHPACYVLAKERGDIYNPPDYVAQVIGAAVGAPFDPARVNEWASDPLVLKELADSLDHLDVECLRNFYRASESIRSEQLTRLRPLTIPVLAMYGEQDRFIKPSAYQQSAAYTTGSFRLVPIPGAEHYPHKEAAQRVNFELERWLKGTDRVA